MRKLLLLLTSCFTLSNATAQLASTDDVKKQLQTENKDTVAFIYGATFNLGFNQGFLHNWAAGGEVASITANSVFSGYTIKMHHKHIWTNNLDMSYGLFYAYSNQFVPRKTEDRIDLTSKYGIRLDTVRIFISPVYSTSSHSSPKLLITMRQAGIPFPHHVFYRLPILH